MQEILLSYGLPGVIILALAGVVIRQYADGKAKDEIILQISSARVDDLKVINASKDAAGEKLAQMVSLIYNKLESEKRRT